MMTLIKHLQKRNSNTLSQCSSVGEGSYPMSRRNSSPPLQDPHPEYREWQWKGWLLFLFLLLWITPASAAVSLPLNGYIRAGKCMPVLITNELVSAIDMNGAVATKFSSGFTGIAPVLILSDATGPFRAGSSEIPLRPLLPDQRLIGIMGADSSIAFELFPSQMILTVPLDASDPLPGPAIAWETLDAVILETAPPKLEEYLALGIAVAIRSPQKPDDRWPWQQIGEAWVIRPALAGPATAIGGEVAYLPTHAWTPARSPEHRRRIVLIGVLVVLFLLVPFFIRSRLAMVATLIISILCFAAVAMWWRRISPIVSAGGAIVVHSPQLTQIDHWTYLAAGSSGGEGSITLARPIVASAGHAAQSGLRLDADGDGSLIWRYALRPNARLATLHRELRPAAAQPAAQMPVLSPLVDLARQAYLSPGSSIAGQLSAEDWPGIVILRE